MKGSNPEIDEAIEKFPDIEKFLIQRIEEKAPLAETLRAAGQIAGIEIPEEEMREVSRREEMRGVPRREELARNAAVPVQA